MNSNSANIVPGAIALVGSGEYTAAMEATDRRLLETLGGPACGRVALLPTASALEDGQPQRWNALGAAHFARLGAQPTPLLLLTREDASDAALVQALEAQNFYYFSGGNPRYLAETLDATRGWSAIRSRWLAGAVVAGCSAGAMMLGEALLQLRELRAGQPPRWQPGCGLAAGIAVLPHFDRIQQRLSVPQLEELAVSAPPGITVVGVDEDTALVRLPAEPGTLPVWHVRGRQTVTVFDHTGRPTVFGSGETIALG
ncbi:MAG: Type 1 glutamine amidotransferase-like domain-containing protein [Chloroflexales bacterium]|nr:Type 1 glutamine amidotransferase-like domain-containing protein [Chloroflexales bacterium]